MKRPSEIQDREREWDELARICRRPGPDLVFLLGRHRAGKSFLLARLARQIEGIYYQAARRTENEQRLRLSAVVGERLGDPGLRRGAPFPDWEGLFGYLGDRARRSPLLVVLDEFPYLSASAPALTSILQSAWDHELSDTRIKLVLSGSHITAMRDLENVDQPLYGRRTSRIDFEPFDYRDAASFLAFSDPRDRLRAYGIFGGLPGHLTLVDPGRSLAENVAEHVLSPTGRLLDEAQHMLDAFLADAEVPYSILEAIAGGQRTWKGITSRVGRDGGSMSRALKWLIEMGLVERAVPITDRVPRRSKRTLYRIRDPYVAFWHRFVSPLVTSGMIGLASGEELWTEHIEPRLDDYMGSVFEACCSEFVRRGEGLPFRPVRLGRWWDATSTHEIDVVALGRGGRALVAECKWGQVDQGDLRRLDRSAERFRQELGAPVDLQLAVFSAGPLTQPVQAAVERGEVLHVPVEALYP